MSSAFFEATCRHSSDYGEEYVQTQRLPAQEHLSTGRKLDVERQRMRAKLCILVHKIQSPSYE